MSQKFFITFVLRNIMYIKNINTIIINLFQNLNFLCDDQKQFIASIAKQLSENKKLSNKQIKKLIALNYKIKRKKLLYNVRNYCKAKTLI